MAETATEHVVANVCGSTMPTPHDDQAAPRGVLAGNLLDLEPLDASWHLFTASRCPWTRIPADAPQWSGVAPEFEDQDPKLDNLIRHREDGKTTGSCLCGAVSFVAASPVRMMNCHCSRCRLSRAAAHATNLFVAIPAGCLDSDPGITPLGHIFTGSKASWFRIEDELPQWEERPG